MSERALVPMRPNGQSAPVVPTVQVETQSVGLMELCTNLARSGYFKDASDPAKAVVKVLYGQELGISPVTAMMSIHIIEGKPAPSANLLAAIVKRSGAYDYRVKTRTDSECAIEFYERGELLGVSTWTRADAERAGLWGRNTWKAYPRQMLFNRCMTDGVRTFCPDVFGGAPVYTAEELGAEVNGEGDPVNRRVDRATGEVIDVTSRVTSAAETEGSYAGATGAGQPTSLADLKAACDKASKALGWTTADQRRERFSVELGRAVTKFSELTADDWQTLAARLQMGTAAKGRAFAVYAELCGVIGADKDDREMRLAIWGQLLGGDLTSGSDLTVEGWQTLGDRLQARLNEERQRQADAAGAASEPAATDLDDPFEEE